MRADNTRFTRRRPRRGISTVLVAIFLVAFVGIAGFAIDMSRGYLSANAAQTRADAAALYGAMELQKHPSVDPASAVATYATAQLGGAVGVVTYGRWNQATATFDSTVALSRSNAVRVYAQKTDTLSIGRLVSRALPSPNRRAIAWLANIQNTTCPAPWGIPLIALNEQLYSTADYTVHSDMYGRLSDSLARVNGGFRVAMILVPRTSWTASTGVWPFDGVDDASPGGGMNAYADQVGLTGCNANASFRIATTESYPASGSGNVPKKTADGAYGTGPASGSMCEPIPKSGPARAECYPVGSGRVGSVGVSRAVSWTSNPVSNSASVLTLSSFKVMCVFVGKGGGGADPAERCSWLDSYIASGLAPAGTATSYPSGTIVGYPELESRGLGAGVSLDTALSLYQRLILVK